jgi:hypothetical protein
MLRWMCAGNHGSSAAALACWREDGEGSDEDDEVCDGDREHKPVDEVEGPHFGIVGVVVLCRVVQVCACDVSWAGAA